MIEWVWPWMLALAPLPWLVRRLVPPANSQEPALRAPFFDEWQQLGADRETRVSAGARRLPAAALWLIWLLLLLAAARPTWIGEAIELPNSGRDLMLAVDISGSMQIEDMQQGQALVPRITAVKQVGADFITRRSGDRLGLILFGSNAYVQSPLSFDTSTVERFLMEAQIGFAGQDTAIGDAIGLAVKRLRKQPQQNHVLILLTDGANTAGSVDPLKAADLAAAEGLRIYTIGVGAESIRVRGLLGTRQVSNNELDEVTLTAIAEKTGGRYFRARDIAGLEAIYQLLDELEPASQDAEVFRPVRELYAWPLAGALLISVLLALAASGLAIPGRAREARHA